MKTFETLTEMDMNVRTEVSLVEILNLSVWTSHPEEQSKSCQSSAFTIQSDIPQVLSEEYKGLVLLIQHDPILSVIYMNNSNVIKSHRFASVPVIASSKPE